MTPTVQSATTVRNIDEMNQFIASQPIDTACCYHVGELMRDRDIENGGSAALHRLANYIWELYERGKVVLLQRRVTPTACVYYAIKA